MDNKEVDLFSPTATIYRDLDAAEAVLHSTIASLHQDDEEIDEMEIKRCASFAMEEEDDDLSEELEQLETSQHALWEELNVSGLNLSAITTESTELHFFGDGNVDEAELSPTRANKTMDTAGLLKESERLIDIVMEESTSPAKLMQTPTNDRPVVTELTPSQPSKTPIQDFIYSSGKKRTFDSKVTISEELNTYFSPNNFPEVQNNPTAAIFRMKSDPNEDKRDDENRPEEQTNKFVAATIDDKEIKTVPTIVHVRSDQNDDGVVECMESDQRPNENTESTITCNENQEPAKWGKWNKGKKNVSMKWLKIPKNVGFGGKRKHRKHDSAKTTIGYAREPLPEEPQSHRHYDRSMNMAQSKTGSTISKRKRDENSAEIPVAPEKKEQNNSSTKRTRTIDEVERNNKKLKRQKEKLLQMITDAWHDKNRTQQEHEKQIECISEALQEKLREAESERLQLVNENQALRTELENVKSQGNIGQQSKLDWQKQFELEMQAKYESKLEQEVAKRIAEQRPAEAILKCENEQLKKKCEQQESVLKNLKTVLSSPASRPSAGISATIVASSAQGAQTRVAAEEKTQKRATHNDTDYSMLLEQARQEVQSEIKVIHDSHAAQVRNLQGQISAEKQRNNQRGLRLRALQDVTERSNQLPIKIKGLGFASSKENTAPTLFAVRRKHETDSTQHVTKLPLPTFRRRSSSQNQNIILAEEERNSTHVVC